MNKEFDYFKRFCLLLLAVALSLLVINYLIPEDKEFTSVDMLADVRQESTDDSLDPYLEQTNKEGDKDDNHKTEVKQNLSSIEKRHQFIQERMDKKGFNKENFLAIEDYSENLDGLKHFFTQLKKAKALGRPVRIAFLGDSFIGSDILVRNLREALQKDFQGIGVGYIGISAKSPGYRRSIKHNPHGWTEKNAVHNMNEAYTIAGQYHIASNGANTSYRMPDAKDCFEQATLYYTSMGTASIQLNIDGNQEKKALPNTEGKLKALQLYKGSAKKGLKLKLISGADILKVYGISLDGNKGISVDNYSLEGASGLQLGAVKDDLSRTYAKARPYDLIVLEYGLNVVGNGKRKNYHSVIKGFSRVVDKLKSYYPKTDILILGVSELGKPNGRKNKGSHILHAEQRQFAKDKGLAFWSIQEALNQEGGIANLKKRGIIGTDYTHLSHEGGAIFAKRLYDALMIEKDYYDK